jgi:hypothetical protein
MTLNQVINRIKALSLAHKQVRNFYKGLVTDFLADKTTNYPSVFLQDNNGNISTGTHATTFNYRMFLLDLVNVSENTNQNVQDVQSDMVSVAMDLVAQMNAGFFDDWAVSTDIPLQMVEENDNDLIAGCIIDFSIRVKFPQNLCQIPTDYQLEIPPEDMKEVFDMEYISTGAEGTSITIPGLAGKRIILIIRENNPLHKVSNNPDSAEYTWDNTTIGTSVTITARTRFLILYRNY